MPKAPDIMGGSVPCHAPASYWRKSQSPRLTASTSCSSFAGLQRSRASTSRSTSIGPLQTGAQPFRRYNRRKLCCPVDWHYCRAGQTRPILIFVLPFCYPCGGNVHLAVSSTASRLSRSPRRLQPLATALPPSGRNFGGVLHFAMPFHDDKPHSLRIEYIQKSKSTRNRL